MRSSASIKLALLGGSFNPPHIGHTAIAEEALIAFDLDMVLFIPVNIPPHKTFAVGASARDRMAMLRLALRGEDRFCADDREIRRGGISYTWDTLAEIETQYGNRLAEPVYLIIGDDLAADFDSWNHAGGLAEKTTIALARRLPEGKAGAFARPHRVIENARLDISSSDIRARVKKGLAWRYLVSPAVYQYIVKHKLYGYR